VTTCVVIGILVAIGLYSYYSAEKAMASQFNEQQLILARQAAQGMEDHLADLRQIVNFLARSPEVGNLKKDGAGANEGDALKALLENAGGAFDFVFQVDERGNLMSTYPVKTLKEGLGKPFSLGPYFQKVRSTGKSVLTHVGPFREEKTSGQAHRFGSILILCPVFRGSDFGGLLGAGIDFQRIYERFVHPIRSGARGASWMINGGGTFIAHYDPNLLGKDAFSARRERDPGLSAEQIDRIMKERMLAGQAGMGEYTSGWHLGEKGRIKKLIAYSPVRLDDPIGSVAVVVPYSDVTRLVWGSFQNSAILILVMACTLLAGTYVGHKINQERIRAAEKVKWGEEIMRSQNRLQALFDGAPDAIAIVDRDYRVLMVNKTALNWGWKILWGDSATGNSRGAPTFASTVRRRNPSARAFPPSGSGPAWWPGAINTTCSSSPFPCAMETGRWWRWWSMSKMSPRRKSCSGRSSSRSVWPWWAAWRPMWPTRSKIPWGPSS
jgi:two-component system NtrC family sensor kinase